jgi:hypothetical protein
MIRRLAMELGSWRCGLNRGTAGPEVARWAEAWAAERTSGGKSAAFGNQKTVSRDAQGAMMMEAAPGTALKVVEPQLLLEFLKVALNSPAQLGNSDQFLKWCGGGQVGQPILSRFGSPCGPFDKQPLLAVGDGLPIAAVGGTHPDRGKARAQHAGSALTPAHRAIGRGRKAQGQLPHRQGLLGGSAAQQLTRSPAAASFLRKEGGLSRRLRIWQSALQ